MFLLQFEWVCIPIFNTHAFDAFGHCAFFFGQEGHRPPPSPPPPPPSPKVPVRLWGHQAQVGGLLRTNHTASPNLFLGYCMDIGGFPSLLIRTDSLELIKEKIIFDLRVPKKRTCTLLQLENNQVPLASFSLSQSSGNQNNTLSNSK